MSNNWFARTTDSANSWAGRNPSVNRDFNVYFDISTSGAWATLEINGAIGLVAETIFGIYYEVLTNVYQDFEPIYQLSGPPPAGGSVYQDFSLIYAVDSEVELVEVERDFEIFWQADGVAFSDFPVVFTVNQDTAFPGWNEETVTDEDWAAVALAAKTWAAAAKPTTTWN